MKFYISIILFSCILANANAQITIDQADLPSPNDKIIRARHTADATDFTTTGANFTWNFSALQAASIDSLDYFNITSAPLFTQFVFNGFNANTKSQMFNNSGNPLNFPAIVSAFFQVDSSFSFIKKNATRFAKTGFSLKLNGIDLPLPYDSNDVVYKLPFTFGSKDSSNSSFEINIPLLDFFYYQQSQKRVNTVDGWGKLKLPNFTADLDVLRIKSELYIVDTFRIDTGFVQFGIKTPRPKQIEYKWMAKGYDAPVLEVVGSELAGNFTATSVKFFPAPVPTSLQNLSNSLVNYIYPNPAKNYVQMQLVKPAVVSVCNNLGQVVYTKMHNSGNIFIDAKSWQNGLYSVQILDNFKQLETQKLIINK